MSINRPPKNLLTDATVVDVIDRHSVILQPTGGAPRFTVRVGGIYVPQSHEAQAVAYLREHLVGKSVVAERDSAFTEVQGGPIYYLHVASGGLFVGQMVADGRATVFKPDAVKADLIIDAFKDKTTNEFKQGCSLKGADIAAMAIAAPTVKERAFDLTGEGFTDGKAILKIETTGNDITATVEATGKAAGLLGTQIKVNTKTQFPGAVEKTKAAENLKAAVSEAAPVIAANTKPVEQVAQVAVQEVSATPKAQQKAQPKTVTPPAQQTQVSSTPDASWWNEEAFKKFGTGPQTTTDVNKMNADVEAGRARYNYGD